MQGERRAKWIVGQRDDRGMAKDIVQKNRREGRVRKGRADEKYEKVHGGGGQWRGGRGGATKGI